MNELLEAAKAVLSWHDRHPTMAMPQCPRMPDGQALACRCSEICSHERLRLAVEAEARKAAQDAGHDCALPRGGIESAGFASVASGKVRCWGKSESLGIPCAPDDSAALAQQLGLAAA